jgi:predicted ATPase
LKSVIPDMETIRILEKPEDKHRYLSLRYRNGQEVPSWGASGGTLRLLALTLPAYLPDFSGVYLIEEPESGMHPRAVRSVFRALSSVSPAQILLTTYSPVILSEAELPQVICFAKTDGGATDVIPGNEHPALKEWRGKEKLGVLFADGVLG